MAIGIVVGSLLIATFVGVVWQEQPRPGVALLVGGLTFVLAGIFVGFNSPGRTVVEPGVAGGIIAIAAASILSGLGVFPVGAPTVVLWLILGSLLAALGGWVGELMQGTFGGETQGKKIQWPWIVVGVVLGFVFNIYFVFVGRALFSLGAMGIMASFGLSFLLTGFFVGFFSPGVTLAEPAIAGVLLVAVNTVVTSMGFQAPFPLGAIVLGFIAAFCLALAGGWVGELVQEDTRHPETGETGD
ncbi:MAG: hypothetical protein RQ751_06475 [Longimicrobiales bacterium]|nr:hypothetical protein [Longimicrobiales bacterium]